jgi:hypothetical protein
MGQELRGADGQVVGYFYTADEYRKLEYALAKLESYRQEAEDRAKGVTRTYDGTNGMSTKDAIAYLERLGREAKDGK